MTDLLLSPIPLQELKLEISDTIKKELQTFLSTQERQEHKESRYLTRKETAERLGITLPTLNEYTKAGKVIGYRIGSRVRYKANEVEAALIMIKTKGRAA